MIITEILPTYIEPIGSHLGFVSCVIDVGNGERFKIDNIAIYESESAKYGLRCVYPSKKGKHGEIRECFKPITKNAGDLLQEAITKKFSEGLERYGDKKQEWESY